MTRATADELDAQVAAYARAGENEAAAELLSAHGRHREASEKYADAWKFERAAISAIKAGDLPLAYQQVTRWPHSGPDREQLSARIMNALLESPGAAEQAAGWARDRGYHHDAARLWVAAGEFEKGVEAYERAGALPEAARLLEQLGDYRGAGRLYEARLREHPDDAATSLRLGQILLSFGRRDAAASVLQPVTSGHDADALAGQQEFRNEARHLLIHCFWAMGREDAAHRHLDALRRTAPDLPAKADAYVLAYPLPQGASEHDANYSEGRLLAGRYEILEPIGAGATGRVLLARDTFYERHVAIKVLTVSVMGVGREAYSRFLREARIASAVAHPNIVQMTEFNPQGPFLVMEYMSGGTLEGRIHDARTRGMGLEPHAIHHIATSVLRGLDALHRRGVVHRDIKPANIFFGPAGNVKVGDFGAAHLTDLGSTLTGALLGTLAYMSPEQITGGTAPGPSTDLYAFGILLYELLTGDLPFDGPDFVSQHLHQTPSAPSQKAAYLAPLDELCARLLEKHPSKRPQNAETVEAILASLPWDDLAANHQARAAKKNEAPPSDKTHEQIDANVSAARPSTSGDDGRFVTVEALKDRVVIARDEFLKRLVRIEPADAMRRDALRAFAGADHPNLQAVYDIDEQGELAVLERPQGRLLSDVTLTAELVDRVAQEMGAALDSLARRGLTHGQIDSKRIRVGAQRCVLLLPTAGAATGPSDRDALAALVAALRRQHSTKD